MDWYWNVDPGIVAQTNLALAWQFSKSNDKQDP